MLMFLVLSHSVMNYMNHINYVYGGDPRWLNRWVCNSPCSTILCVCVRDNKVYIYDLYPQTDKDFCWQDVSVYSTLKQEWRGFFSKCYV